MRTVRPQPRVLWLALSVLVLAAGCSSPEKDWREARQADTVEAYQKFNRQHPESPLTAEAIKRIEEKNWGETTHRATLASYRKYLEEFPHGIYAAEAARKIESVLFTGTIQGPPDMSVAGCKVFLFAVGSDGTVSATLRDENMGLTNSSGTFAILLNRAVLTTAGSIALIVDCSSSWDVLVSRLVHIGTNPKDALSVDVGHLKVAPDADNTGDMLRLTPKEGEYLFSMDILTGAHQKLLNGVTVTGRMATGTP